MTGWRVGWLIARRDLAARATCLNEFVVSHAPSFAQRAGETALLWGEKPLAEMLVRLKENRDFCLAALRKMPRVVVPSPDGAFYLFPRIEGVTDSFDFCRRLLMETQVGLAPGVAFGAGGEVLGPHLLRRRETDPRGSHGPARIVSGSPVGRGSVSDFPIHSRENFLV